MHVPFGSDDDDEVHLVLDQHTSTLRQQSEDIHVVYFSSDYIRKIDSSSGRHGGDIDQRKTNINLSFFPVNKYHTVSTTLKIHNCWIFIVLAH